MLLFLERDYSCIFLYSPKEIKKNQGIDVSLFYSGMVTNITFNS